MRTAGNHGARQCTGRLYPWKARRYGADKHGRRFGERIIKNLKGMEALMCLFGIAIGAGLVTGLWFVAKFAARNIDGEYDE